jgi:hypothetical protein
MNVSADVQRPVLDGACRNAGRRILGDDVTVVPVAYATPPNYSAASALVFTRSSNLFGHLRGQGLAQLGPSRRDEHHQHWSTRHRRQRHRAQECPQLCRGTPSRRWSIAGMAGRNVAHKAGTMPAASGGIRLARSKGHLAVHPARSHRRWRIPCAVGAARSALDQGLRVPRRCPWTLGDSVGAARLRKPTRSLRESRAVNKNQD